MSNSFDARSTLDVNGKSYQIYRFDPLRKSHDLDRLPFSLKILLENLLRKEDGTNVTKEHIEALKIGAGLQPLVGGLHQGVGVLQVRRNRRHLSRCCCGHCLYLSGCSRGSV